MTHLPYIVGAYAVFAVVLGWDYVSSALQIRRELRIARQRAARAAARPASRDASTELSR
ncbi:heme exporter protein CcmD [Lysobacter enzymogenes]|uniref:Heme exporter protein D n=1 Tax=Lysobacter enzymogenes TaxID=69 RepID=A0A0S2DI91_LYSEN|nr:heme exporter protein CcmD [Lysobacter enzymogenes]ALN58177.1 heme exporter protein CcmD [Lysobacter enzymogenes]QCW26628.1 heme exporter protein CcmD [Lysobacter enzymogenes]QQQ03475.1 heme exporter protein CcmD [Lysobacter enzymogenes]UZW63056.1 heme exporter protein CcmD [Lysobacter enzymogenes]